MAVVSAVLFSISCLLGIPGNVLVIWIVGVKMKKTVTTIWYANLAFADLLCCLAIPFLMAYIVLDYYWPYGAAMCKIFPTVVYINMFASVFILTLISVDRLSLVIIRPVWAQNHRSIFGARLLCGLVWFLALLLSLPELIYREMVDTKNRTICDYADNQVAIRAIHTSMPVFGFLVPLLVITVCNLLIARRMSVGRFVSQKALCVMVGVVTAFFLCWMPYHTVGLVIVYGERSSVEGARAVEPLAYSVAFINSCLNPVLYVCMGQDFKEKVRVSLRRIFENAFNEDAGGSSVGSKRQDTHVQAMDVITNGINSSDQNTHGQEMDVITNGINSSDQDTHGQEMDIIPNVINSSVQVKTHMAK